MITRTYTGIIVFLILSACARTLSRPEPISQPAIATDTIKSQAFEVSPSKVWKLTPDDQLQHYISLITTEIQQLDEHMNQKDTSTLTAHYSLSITRVLDQISIRGSIDSFSVYAGRIIGVETPLFQFPQFFTGNIQNHQIHLDIIPILSRNLSVSECGELPRIALRIVQRNLFSIPLHLSIGTTWQDSTSVTICNGTLPTNIVSVKTYVVAALITYKSKEVFTIARTEVASSFAEGSLDQHRIIVKGETNGAAKLYLDKTTGTMLTLEAQNKTTLSIQSSGRLQHFLQTSRERITRAD